MSKILLIAGHGQNDPGAVGGIYNERDTMRKLVLKIKELIPDRVDVYDIKLDAYQQNALATTSYKNVIEFHMDGSSNSHACGGHVIISKGLTTDNLDENLKAGIEEQIGIWSGVSNGFSYRDDLQNLNVAKRRGINYRLLELGFITNIYDQQKSIKEMDVLAKILADRIIQKESINTSPAPVRPPIVESIWKNEIGVFTANTTINVRSEASTNSQIVASYSIGESVNYDRFLVEQNGFVWIHYISFTGLSRYMATGESKNGQRLNSWGTFK